MSNKILKIMKIAATIFLVTFILWNIIKTVLDIRFIDRSMDAFVFLCFVASLITWLVIWIKHSTKYRILKISAISIALVVSIGFFVLNFLMFGFLDYHVIKMVDSPSKKNTLVVVEGGYLDAVYMAYPVKGYLFYHIQDNGYVSNHDDWGGSEFTVTWDHEDRAIVKFHSNFTPNEGSNKNNEIVVQFNAS